MGSCCLTQGPQPVSLWWSRGVGWEWGGRLKRELIYVIMTDLCCMTEVNTALQSNYPSIKKKVLPCHHFPLKNPQKFLRNRYIFPERGVSSFSELPIQMIQVLGADGAFGFEELHSACHWAWLYDWFPPSGQKPSSDFRRAPIARGHRHLENFCALPVVWTGSRLMSSGMNGSVLWLASCLIVWHLNGAECPCWTICEIFGLLCFIHSDSWRLLRWSAFNELLFKKLLLYIRIFSL